MFSQLCVQEQQPKRPLGGPKRFEIRNIPPQGTKGPEILTHSITYVPSIAEEHEVKLSIARAYHTAIAQMTRRRQNDDDEKGDKPVLMNFEVKLRQWEDSSGWLKPTGSLLIPSWSGLFKEYIASNPVYVKYLPDWNDKVMRDLLSRISLSLTCGVGNFRFSSTTTRRR